MGCSPLKRNCLLYDETLNNREQNIFAPAPNPNPGRFKIKKIAQVNNNVVSKIKYIDCTNYEGLKIILFKNVNINNIINLKSIDPHFNKQNDIKPFARFEPTEEGWSAALLLASSI